MKSKSWMNFLHSYSPSICCYAYNPLMMSSEVEWISWIPSLNISPVAVLLNQTVALVWTNFTCSSEVHLSQPIKDSAPRSKRIPYFDLTSCLYAFHRIQIPYCSMWSVWVPFWGDFHQVVGFDTQEAHLQLHPVQLQGVFDHGNHIKNAQNLFRPIKACYYTDF